MRPLTLLSWGCQFAQLAIAKLMLASMHGKQCSEPHRKKCVATVYMLPSVSQQLCLLSACNIGHSSLFKPGHSFLFILFVQTWAFPFVHPLCSNLGTPLCSDVWRKTSLALKRVTVCSCVTKSPLQSNVLKTWALCNLNFVQLLNTLPFVVTFLTDAESGRGSPSWLLCACCAVLDA